MIDAALILRSIVNPALDGTAHNQHQAQLIFNPSPEVDSLAERIQALHEHDVPAHVITALFADLRAILESNGRESEAHRTVAKAGDDMARTIGAARTRTCAPIADHLTVTGVKRLIGGPDGPLAILADPAGRKPADIARARNAVRTVARETPDIILRRDSLRNQLGARRYDLLLTLREEWGRADQ